MQEIRGRQGKCRWSERVRKRRQTEAEVDDLIRADKDISMEMLEEKVGLNLLHSRWQKREGNTEGYVCEYVGRIFTSEEGKQRVHLPASSSILSTRTNLCVLTHRWKMGRWKDGAAN